MTSFICWKVLEADSYYRSFIDKDIRPDDRGFLEARPITLKVGSINTAEASATVRLGNTTVVCGIKAEIAVPHLRSPDAGIIVPNVELYPCCSPSVKPGPPGQKAMCSSKFLSNVIQSSNLLDLSSLCIIPNKIVWCLYCDIVCLDYDGNLNDAALLALVAALRNLKLPKVEYDEDTEDIVVAKEYTEKLDLKSNPTATTFTLYQPGIYLLDPSEEDESNGSGEVTVVLKDEETLCSSHKSGGQVLPTDVLREFIEKAKKRVPELNRIIDAAFSKKDKT